MSLFVLSIFSAVFLYPQHPAESFSFPLFDRLKPSSTRHLSDLLELYDVFQDPSILESSEEWKSVFESILNGVEVTSEGVVEGKGLIATRDFSEGEVVALYPIHALGYSNGRYPARIHDRSERVYGPYTPRSNITSATSSTKYCDGIIGTSDLVYFEGESHVFDEFKEDFSFAMSDPTGKYHFDVNPERALDRTLMVGEESGDSGCSDLALATHNADDGLFLAHYVNDASFADFSPIVAASRELMKEQQQYRSGSKHGGAEGVERKNEDKYFAQKGKELEASAAQLAVEYLESSTGTREKRATPLPAPTKEGTPPGGGFNAVMCGFGPPPLTAYVTTRPVRRGEEFLATYGLGYWLGKAFPDDDESVLDAALDALDAHPDVEGAQERAGERVDAALDAGNLALRVSYKEHTALFRDTLRELRRRRRKQNRKQRRRRWRETMIRRLGFRSKNS